MADELDFYIQTDDVLHDMQCIIDGAQQHALTAVNLTLIRRNWLMGKRIFEEALKKKERAEYGTEIIKDLSRRLTAIYGKGFTKTNLYNFYAFYQTFPNIFHTACGKFNEALSWSHYRTLLQVSDPVARAWYAKEAAEQAWAVKTLQRNVSSQYYYRLLKSQIKEPVAREMQQLTAPYQQNKLEFIKNPVIADRCLNRIWKLASLPICRNS